MLLGILLAIQTASPREAPPVLEFPTRGLDDSAAYDGYTARVYRDSRGNSVEIYHDAKTGRVVHLWADALNESIGFTTRRAVNSDRPAPARLDARRARLWVCRSSPRCDRRSDVRGARDGAARRAPGPTVHRTSRAECPTEQ